MPSAAESAERSTPTAETRPPADAASRWVAEYADLLYRQALLRLGDVEDAKDVVQETLIAAVRALREHGPEARSEKAWLLGILKHKVLDQLRRRYRQPTVPLGDDLEKLEESQFEPGDGISHWQSKVAPREWHDVEGRFARGEFAAALRLCLDKLPDRHARAFVLRELDGMETERLCAEFNLNANHMFVLLHRARLALRRCLELGGLRSTTRIS